MKLNRRARPLLIALLFAAATARPAQVTPVEVAHITNGLRIYDVSTPANPTLVGQTNNGRFALAVAVSGRYAYLANDTDGLRIYDISNPAFPLNVGHSTNDVAEHSFQISVSGDLAYMCNWICGMRVCDVTTKTNPITLTCTKQS